MSTSKIIEGIPVKYTTTDAVATVIWSIVGAKSIWHRCIVMAHVTAQLGSGTSGEGYFSFLCQGFASAADHSSIVLCSPTGTPIAPIETENYGCAPGACALKVDGTGSNIILEVTGIAATTINWNVTLSIHGEEK